ncbi:MAG: VOC family protein [Proteobacteria bacterium]|nr:VOC family protein [Pseudomonadota bacterium]
MGGESLKKARAIGINHIGLEVDDIDAALEFYGDLFAFSLRSRSDNQAFIDMVDQFINLASPRRQGRDDDRHFGFVVDDPDAVRAALAAKGVPVIGPRNNNFFDPWGNRIEIVGYKGIQFSKTEAVLNGMGLGDLEKTAAAKRELSEKGLG